MASDEQEKKDGQPEGASEPAEDLRCSFCNNSQREVKKLIAGPMVFICDQCVEICVDIIVEDRRLEQREERSKRSLGTLRETLGKRVVGQPKARQVLSAAFHRHVVSPAADPGRLPKSHILLAGPTGSGKSFLARTLAGELDLAFARVDATRLTGESYFKELDPFGLLLEQAGDNRERAGRGVVFIDQIDRVSDTGTGEDEAAGRRFQESLLSLLDGTVTRFTRSVAGAAAHLHTHAVRKSEGRIDTSGILFVCSGTFRGLELEAASSAESDRAMLEEALVAGGLMPELVARFGTICTFDRLTAADLAGILRLPEGSPLDEYRELFRGEGLELSFNDEAIETLAGEAARRGGGARSLRAVLEALALELSFADPSASRLHRTLAVDARLVERSLS